MGDAAWQLQNLRGKIGQELGYDAIKMNDEHGTSYLIPFGSKAKYNEKYAQGGSVLDKLKRQNFEQDNSQIVSAIMHLREAISRADDWLQKKMRQVAGRPYEDVMPDEQAQAALDLAGLMQLGGTHFEIGRAHV